MHYNPRLCAFVKINPLREDYISAGSLFFFFSPPPPPPLPFFLLSYSFTKSYASLLKVYTFHRKSKRLLIRSRFSQEIHIYVRRRRGGGRSEIENKHLQRVDTCNSERYTLPSCILEVHGLIRSEFDRV